MKNENPFVPKKNTKNKIFDQNTRDLELSYLSLKKIYTNVKEKTNVKKKEKFEKQNMKTGYFLLINMKIHLIVYSEIKCYST